MGTWGSAGVWHEERQRYRARSVNYDGYLEGLGKWLVENAPDAESALETIERGVVGPSWRGAPTWEKRVDYSFHDGRWWSELPEKGLLLPLRLHLAFEDEAAHAALAPLLAEVDDAMSGAPPTEAPPEVDVPTALSAMHDENERLRGLLWKAREVLWRCDGVGSEAKTQHEAITKALEGDDE